MIQLAPGLPWSYGFLASLQAEAYECADATATRERALEAAQALGSDLYIATEAQQLALALLTQNSVESGILRFRDPPGVAPLRERTAAEVARLRALAQSALRCARQVLPDHATHGARQLRGGVEEAAVVVLEPCSCSRQNARPEDQQEARSVDQQEARSARSGPCSPADWEEGRYAACTRCHKRCLMIKRCAGCGKIGYCRWATKLHACRAVAGWHCAAVARIHPRLIPSLSLAAALHVQQHPIDVVWPFAPAAASARLLTGRATGPAAWEPASPNREHCIALTNWSKTMGVLSSLAAQDCSDSSACRPGCIHATGIS